MARLDMAIDLDDLPVRENSYDPVPPGWYTATIQEADAKPTKDGTGQYIKIRWRIDGPAHEGRIVFGNLNVRNKSVKAEEIGRQQMGEVLRAVGLQRLEDTDQLIGATLSIKLDIRPANDQYAAQNEIRGYKPSDNAPPVATAAPSAAKKSPPWAAKR